MPTALHVPRINNNDDEVKLVSLKVAVGDVVRAGQVVAEVETDKAVIEVEASEPGHVLALRGAEGETVRVGAVLIWLGAQADETAPDDHPTSDTPATGTAAPTAKARDLLRRYGLQAGDVRASGARLSAQDVQQHADRLGLQPTDKEHAVAQPTAAPMPIEPGQLQPLRSDQRGMLATVLWHRDVAVPGYIELPYDPAPWDAYARDFGARHQLLLNPLLPLMAQALAALAASKPEINATLAGEQRHVYRQVNLGFTVQAGDVLYLAVLRDAGALDELSFSTRLIDLQRRAAGHQLSAAETQGSTIGFSSMARWKIGRHIPVLAPHTALMVAHATDPDGRAVLGATYDHRVLHGAAVAQVLRHISQPRPAR
jgi:pyruvate/2-oxoglutarate dehydrogenase complex dihydrolipoamide acyltransferase (E2) component